MFVFQVSNWFINARVRLWKPMVEEMYQQESKEEGEHHQDDDDDDQDEENKLETSINYNNQNKNGPPSSSSSSALAQTPMPPPPPPPSTYTTTSTATPAKRSEINDPENDPSVLAINTQNCFSENQATAMSYSYTPINITSTTTGNTSTTPQSFPATLDADTCRRGSMPAGDDGSEIGSTLIRFGTTAGDVSLTLGLRHAGNLPEKNSFSVRDFGGC